MFTNSKRLVPGWLFDLWSSLYCPRHRCLRPDSTTGSAGEKGSVVREPARVHRFHRGRAAVRGVPPIPAGVVCSGTCRAARIACVPLLNYRYLAVEKSGKAGSAIDLEPEDLPTMPALLRCSGNLRRMVALASCPADLRIGDSMERRQNLPRAPRGTLLPAIVSRLLATGHIRFGPGATPRDRRAVVSLIGADKRGSRCFQFPCSAALVFGLSRGR